MNKVRLKNIRRRRRRRGIRKRLIGTPQRPRVTVYRSLKHIYAQIIDDDAGATICHASTRDKGLRDTVGYGGNKDAAVAVGKALAERAVAKGVSSVCFDRNGRRFHGRIKALADALREGGLEF